jgi:hypothetical protein
MYLNHQVVPNYALTLRNGEERDLAYLADILGEVWERIRVQERTAILARGYGRIDVDVMDARPFRKVAQASSEIRLKRNAVDSYSRADLAYIVAREFARKLDEFEHPNIVPKGDVRRAADRRIVQTLERWGYPPELMMQFTPADKERIRSIGAEANAGKPQEGSAKDSQGDPEV